MSLLTDASLLLTPNAYKEGKLYSVIPSNGNGDFTATRATTATRVNSAGLVDLVPYNLLQQSEMFSQAIWTKSALSITANTTTAPDGTLTADTLRIGVDASSVSHRLYQYNSTSPTGTYTASYYLKKANQKWVQLIYVADSVWGLNSWANFDLENGVIGNIGSGAIATITDVGNGWYRCTLQGVSILNTGSTFCEVISTNNSNSNRYPFYQSLVAEDVCFIWGAQFVEGTSARDYLRTETRLNIPRVDYSLGGCPNILLEPQRTNLALQSSSFDNTTTWINGIGGTGVYPIRTANTTISPSGVQDADTIVFDRGAGNTLSDLSYVQQSATVVTNATHFFSVWLKATTSGDVGKQVYIRCGGGGVLQAITLTANWARYETSTSLTSGSNGFQIGNRGTITTGNLVSVDLWGAQVEAGAYATSYIPTTTASVTRNADSITRNNIFTNGLITASGGTWYFELKNNISLTRSAGADINQSLGVSNGTDSGLVIRTAGTSRAQIYKYVSGSPILMRTTAADVVKVAIKWNGTSADVFENGVKVVSASSFTTTNMNFLQGSAVDFPKYISAMLLAPTPLTDAECIQLTTL